MRSLILAAALALSAHAATAATVPVTPATVDAAFQAAQPGDTLVLTGVFGDIALKNRAFAPPLTVDAHAAQLAGVALSAVSGVEWTGGTFHPDRWSGAFYATGCAHIHVAGISAFDSNTVTGVVFRGCQDVSLRDSRLDRPTVGVTTLDDDGVIIQGNDLIGVSADGMTSASVRNGDYGFNVCAGNIRDPQHHPDCWQGWTVAGLAQGAGIRVHDNDASGGTQGFGDFGGDARGIANLVIEHNHVRSTFPQGVGVVKSPGAIVRWNDVHTLPLAPGAAKPPGYSRTSVNATAPGALHCGNTAEAGAGKPAWADAAC